LSIVGTSALAVTCRATLPTAVTNLSRLQQAD
jgi:hypothetical protein